MIGFVVFSLRRAWQGFWRNALMSLAATATMVLMLLLLAGFWILQTGLQASLDYTESKVEVVADPGQRQAVRGRPDHRPLQRCRGQAVVISERGARRAPAAPSGARTTDPLPDANPLHAEPERSS
jgi:hypothetical protein